MSGRRAESKGERGSKAGSELRVESREPDAA